MKGTAHHHMDSNVYLYWNMQILHASLSWRKVWYVISSTSNSCLARIPISTHMFHNIYPLIHMRMWAGFHLEPCVSSSRGPHLGYPWLCYIHSMVVMTLFPSMATLGLPWMISWKSRVSDCRLTLKTVLTDQTFTTCGWRKSWKNLQTERSKSVPSSLGSVETWSNIRDDSAYVDAFGNTVS